MHELYTCADPGFTGRATVPVLWDTAQDTIVNNESADILRMFDTAFEGLAPETPSLFPAALAKEIDALALWLYDRLDNCVYKAGFASSQFAYDEASSGCSRRLRRSKLGCPTGGPFCLASSSRKMTSGFS